MKKLIFVIQDNCIPCQQLKPLVEEFCWQLKIPLQYVDVTNDWKRATKLNVKTTPHLLIEENSIILDSIESRRPVLLLEELSTKFDLSIT